MNNEVISQAKGEKEICSFDIPDEALERAASAERQAFTWHCTTTHIAAFVTSIYNQAIYDHLDR